MCLRSNDPYQAVQALYVVCLSQTVQADHQTALSPHQAPALIAVLLSAPVAAVLPSLAGVDSQAVAVVVAVSPEVVAEAVAAVAEDKRVSNLVRIIT